MNDLFSPLTVAGLYHGDSRDVLKTLPDNSIDSVVTDPPYALVSIVKRFGGKNAAPAKSGTSGVYARASAGFMGQSWDTGEVAFAAEFWSEVYRVLKPGGHVVSFGGTRTYHRMAVAIEDAGFEIRDQIQWLYGTGFPKSHDVSKAIDKMNGREFEDRYELGRHIRERRELLGISRKEMNERFNSVAICNHWEAQDRNNAAVPTPSDWEVLKVILGCDTKYDELVDRVGAEREVVGYSENGIAGGSGEFVSGNQKSAGFKAEFDITRPATAEAEQWEGWGTALKPANEPICLARKPLDGTVAENVLKWGTGAINIDGCRVETDGPRPLVTSNRRLDNNTYGAGLGGSKSVGMTNQSRFPANVITDGSVEMPNGAQRFFYSAKASKADRGEGNSHPTVKPTDLMRYLCRLVTPPGGIVLDPFMGSGSTGKAARLEGFQFVGIEREEQYFKIAKERVTT